MKTTANQKYLDWITIHVTNPLGTCASVTTTMRDAFPELVRVRGHYICPIWGPREHWWLKDSDGNVIDPTATQFPSRGTGDYKEWDNSQPEPTGRCPNCGGYCYNNSTCCSDKCGHEYAMYIRKSY